MPGSRKKLSCGKAAIFSKDRTSTCLCTLVRFEDIAAYNHELALLGDSEPSHLINYVEPCTAEAGLSVMA